jgi:hypothetical protein
MATPNQAGAASRASFERVGSRNGGTSLPPADTTQQQAHFERQQAMLAKELKFLQRRTAHSAVPDQMPPRLL